MARGRDAKAAANWVINELYGRLNKEGREIAASPVSAAQLGAILDLIAAGTISGKIAKDLFEIVWTEGGDPAAIVEARGMKQVTDLGAIEKVVDEIVAGNPDKAAEAKANPKLVGWFVGQAMKASGGKANPQAVNELLQAQARRLTRASFGDRRALVIVIALTQSESVVEADAHGACSDAESDAVRHRTKRITFDRFARFASDSAARSASCERVREIFFQHSKDAQAACRSGDANALLACRNRRSQAQQSAAKYRARNARGIGTSAIHARLSCACLRKFGAFAMQSIRRARQHTRSSGLKPAYTLH